MTQETGIYWALDTEDGDVDPIDPLGDVEIIGEDGRAIVERCTNVDLFLLALTHVVKSLRREGVAVIPLIVEPGELRATMVADGFELSYASEKLRFSNLTVFATRLANQVEALLEVLVPAARRAGASPAAHAELRAFVDEDAEHG